jgi:hypothetical protein
LSGLTTDFPEACNGTTYPTQNTETVTTMSTAGNACTNRLYFTGPGTANADMLTALTTPKGIDTAISGTPSLAVNGRVGVTNQTLSFQLGYVTAGVFSGFGTPATQAFTITQSSFTVTLTGQTGTVPAGSSLAVKVRKVTPSTDSMRFYWSTTYPALTVTETPVGVSPALQTITTAAGVSTSLAVGDKIVVDLEIETNAVVIAGNYAAAYFWGSGTPSRVLMPAAVTFAYAGPFGTVSPASARHDVAGYSGVHQPNETGADIAGSKHVECADCHSPHGAKAGRHTARSNVAGAVLTGAPAVQPNAKTTNWNTTAYTFTDTTVGAATPEAYVCFRCHSSSNTAIPTHPGTNAAPLTAAAPWNVGGGGFTNTAHEFQTVNQSYHPVLGALPATDPGANGSNRLQVATRLINGWVPGDRMTCTDCHGADAASPAAQGPHGSAYAFMLRGTSKRWPYQANGTTLWALNNTATGSGTADGLFCMNCHPNPASSNSLHIAYLGENRTEHTSNYQCVKCHIRVPHGGKVSRLIVTANAPARYKVTGATPILDWVTKPTTGSMTTSNINDGSMCGKHTDIASGESW